MEEQTKTIENLKNCKFNYLFLCAGNTVQTISFTNYSHHCHFHQNGTKTNSLCLLSSSHTYSVMMKKVTDED